MASSIEVTIKGDKELAAKMKQMSKDLKGSAMRSGMQQATMLLVRAAKRNLKPWRGPGTGGISSGRLRSSIIGKVSRRGRGFVGIAGSNLHYAPYVELGTRPHFVPRKYIGRWARRHGLGDRGVFVSGIALRFFQKAFEDNQAKVAALVGKVVAKIVVR